MGVLGESIVKKVYPKKAHELHKGQYGKLLVVGGSEIFTNAPATVGMAALRSGADTVYFVGPERSMNRVADFNTSFVTMPLEVDYMDTSVVDDVFDFAQKMKVTGIVVGPGLWREEKTKQFALKIIEGFEIPMVVDADAIRALSRKPDLVRGKEVVLTPHQNELHELVGVEASSNMKERCELVKKWAGKLKTTILLKGPIDVISDGEDVSTNDTGNPYMTKGGFGDMLTGVCGAIMSRRENKIPAYEAACAAAYINGAAGDIAAKEKKEGLLVSDAIERIPEVIR